PPLDPQFRMPAASLPSGQSFRRTALRSPAGCAVLNFLSLSQSALANSQRVAATRPVQIPSPNNPRLLRAALRPPFSPYPARKQPAPARRSLLRADSSKTKVHPDRASPHPARSSRAFQSGSPSARLPLTPLP